MKALSNWIIKKTRIYKHTFLENLLSFIIVCIMALMMMWLILWHEINIYQSKLVYPQFEFVEIEEPVEEADIEIQIETISLPMISDAVPIESKDVLNAHDGVAYGPSGKEKYYNLPMDKVVQIMRDKGYAEEDYPYIVRDDGVKCLGDYVIVAASFERYRRGQIIETSLGQGIVCDTGEFAINNPEMIDIAVNW